MKRRLYVYVFFLCVIAVALFLTFSRSQSKLPEFESTTVQRGSVVNIVSVTGKLEPTTRISLAFPTSGRLTRLTVKEGDTVGENTLLAELDGNVLTSNLQEAQARVEQERAVLRSVMAPIRREERALKDSAVKNAEQSLGRAEEAARVTLSRVFVSVDDAIREAADEMFEKTGLDARPGIAFTYGTTKYYLQPDSATKLTLSEQRRDVEGVLSRLEERSNDPTQDIEEMLIATDRDLEIVQSFLTTLGGVVNKYMSENTSEQTVYEAYQTSVTSARTTVNTARSDISTTHSGYVNALASLTLALKDLEVSDAGATAEAIATQEASLKSAEAGAQTAYERLREMKLFAPVQGVLSKVLYEVGEIISPNSPVFELITPERFEIEVYIPEADIAEVKLGDSAEVTFDAYGKGELFQAEVVSIALSETIREGVPTYKTTLQLKDEKREGVALRPGMTADVDIVTASLENALYVPLRSIVREGGRTFVRVFTGTGFEERDVRVGLRGSEGTIEIISGIKEGEEVVIYIEEEKA